MPQINNVMCLMLFYDILYCLIFYGLLVKSSQYFLVLIENSSIEIALYCTVLSTSDNR